MRVLIAGASLMVSVLSACAGHGEGQVIGRVYSAPCRMDGGYTIHANFFSANRDGASITIRIQNGGGPPEYTDHLVITIDDTDRVAALLAQSMERDAEGRPVVTLPVAPRGSPGVIVHATLFPNWTCGRRKVTRLGQVVGLWAYEGTMTFRSIDRGDRPQGTMDAGLDDRVTDVPAFHLRLHDPRPVGAVAPPDVPPDVPVGFAELTGSFRFRFSRGVPAVMFP